MDIVSLLLPLLIGLAIGAALVWFVVRSQARADIARLRRERDDARADAGRATSALSGAQATLQQMDDLQTRLVEERERAEGLSADRARIEQANRDLEARLAEQRDELERLNERFTKEFENLANRIFDEKTRTFNQQSKQSLDAVLGPVKERFERFERAVRETHEKGLRDRTELRTEVKQLAELNQSMQEEAQELTQALKGSSKVQGDWGETILQRLLENSGLRAGQEYVMQQSETTEDGRRLRPDVVIHLPDDKKVIIDSKVSLTAYMEYQAASDSKTEEAFAKAHVQSVRKHMKDLSDKPYRDLYGADGLDFILLFIPYENAFTLAVNRDTSIFMDAYEHHIVVVTPSTLLATLKTIASIWKNEYRSRDVQKIVDRGGALLDKFVGFVDAMDDIGDKLSKAQNAYDTAMGRLSTGQGNLVRQAKMLQQLRVNSTKPFPDHHLQDEEGQDDALPGADDD